MRGLWLCLLVFWGHLAHGQVPNEAPSPNQQRQDRQRRLDPNAAPDPRFIKKDVAIESHLGRPRLGQSVSFGAGLGLPGGELARRFGSNGYATLGYNIIFPSKWTLGAEVGFGFGRGVKEDPLSSLRDAAGGIITLDGNPGAVEVTQQMWTLPALRIGKLWVLRERKKPNEWEHGLWLQAGYHWLQYRYQINNTTRDIVQLQGEGEAGYDRLTAGPGAVVEAQYLMLAPSGHYAFFGRAQYQLTAGQSRRAYDYNLQKATTGTLWSGSLNLQIGIALMFLQLDEKDYFYY